MSKPTSALLAKQRKPERIRLQTLVPATLWREIHYAAVDNRTSASKIVEAALTDYVAKRRTSTSR